MWISPEPATMRYKKEKLLFSSYIFAIYYPPKDEISEIALYIYCGNVFYFIYSLTFSYVQPSIKALARRIHKIK